MTDLETPAAVVWPRWCYSNTQQNFKGKPSESDIARNLALNNNTIMSKSPDNKIQNEEQSKMTPDSGKDVKSERLSPDPSSGQQEVPTTTTSPRGTPSPSSSPKCPTPARTKTPSVTGGTPPRPSQSPPGYEALGGLGGSVGVGPSPHLKQMDSLLNRNCSDLMRSLAAKYNNNTPNSYFGAPTSNGFMRPPPSNVLQSLKSNGVPPLIGMPHQLPLPSQVSPKDKPSYPPVTSSSVGIPPGLPLPGAPMFPGAPGHLPGFPPFPMVDVSSTQVLMNLVRNASATATQQAHLDNYIRGSIKRPAETPTSPLDLSSSVPAKRPCPDSSKSFDAKSLFNFPNNEVHIEVVKSPSARSPSPPKARQTPSPKSYQTSGSCSEKNCASMDAIAHWSVDDVAKFVGNIEICAEYAEIFREQRIDGSTLALLTEEHLTTSINMKLGPALKLRSVLAKSIGACNTCLHCNHCHNQTQDNRLQGVS